MRKADIVIASYNGAERLGRTFLSLETMAKSMGFTRDDWHIYLANNNSTDNTAEVARQFTDRLPLTVVDAKRPGKSAALNDAIKLGDAPLVVFTDDDVSVAEDWLAQLLKAADEHPDYSVFAGRIVGHWEKTLDPALASWIPVGSTYALHEHTESGPCDPGLSWGPNKAVRRVAFQNGHFFNERIGPMPTPFYAMGEDSELAKRLSLNGFKSYYVAEAIVHHTIKAATANEDWIVRRAERLGYGIFAVKGMPNYQRRLPSALPLPLELLLLRAVWTIAFPATYLLPRSKRRFWMRWGYYFYRGLWKSYQEFGA